MSELEQVDVFQDFPGAGLDRLARHGQRRRFAAGETLQQQGEVCAAMHVILQGRVRRARAHPDLSEPAVVLELGPGESVGELGVLDQTPWPETVTALEATETLELSARLLAETLLLYPLPAVGLLSTLSRSVRTLAGLEACLAQLSTHVAGTPASPSRLAPAAE